MRRSLFAELPEWCCRRVSTCDRSGRASTTRLGSTLNTKAFADHPEQGKWELRDLRLRMRRAVVRPGGLPAGRARRRLLGFHWTKVHGEVRRAGEEPGHHHDPIGEVYVLGLDPRAHGLGLGRALTVAGLRYLRARGLDQVMLYDQFRPVLLRHRAHLCA